MKKDKLLFLFALLLTTVGYDKDTISPNEEIEYKKNPKRLTAQLLGIFFCCVDTWTRTKDPHHVKVIL